MPDEELQGDDPTLIAIVATAHGYYVDDFNEVPIEVAPLIEPMRVVPLPWFQTSSNTVFIKQSRWYVVTYGFVDAA